jgi:hypothetical protein
MTKADVAVDGAVLQRWNPMNPAKTGASAQPGQDKGKIE